jgi:hypothetical protein
MAILLGLLDSCVVKANDGGVKVEIREQSGGIPYVSWQ